MKQKDHKTAYSGVVQVLRKRPWLFPWIMALVMFVFPQWRNGGLPREWSDLYSTERWLGSILALITGFLWLKYQRQLRTKEAMAVIGFLLGSIILYFIFHLSLHPQSS